MAASDLDLNDVIRFLVPSDLYEFYDALGIKNTDYEKWEIDAGLQASINLQARTVLRSWRKANGKAASRKAILQALCQCGNKEVQEKLEDQWEIQAQEYGNPFHVLAALHSHQDHSTQNDAGQRLVENCRQFGLTLHGNTPSDGNCFFHVVSDQLSLLGLPHQSAAQLRKSVVDFLRLNPTIEGPDGTIDFSVIPPDFDVYLETMSNGEWADAIIVVAMANMLKRDILVITSSPQGRGDQTYQWIVGDANFEGKVPLMVGHQHELHYRSLALSSPALTNSLLPKPPQHRQQFSSQRVTTKKKTPQVTPVQEKQKKKPPRAMDKASDSDFGDVIDLLGPDELQQLYYKLNLPSHDVEKALECTHSHNVELQARRVLQLWRTRHGQTATRQALLESLEKCRNNDAVVAILKKWNFRVMDKASDSDFGDVIELLGPDELQQLYYKLNLPSHDIQKALQLESTGSHNVDLQARRVLQLWRTRHGQTATRQALLEALEKCRNKDAVDTLQKKWNLKDPGFDLEHCQEELISFYKMKMSQIQLLPWCEEQTRNMEEIYVSLELEKAVKGKGQDIHLEKNEDLVNLQTSQSTPATRVIVKGLAGSGKSTLMAKLAYLWAQQNRDSSLAKFELVFILTLRELPRGCSLIDAISQQILAKDSVSQVGLQKYIQSHPDKVLLLLDGFDEYSAPDLNYIQGNVEETIAYKICRKMCVIVTTRPHKQLGKCQSFYESVRLMGFSPENAKLYINKFFLHDTKLVKELNSKLSKTNILTFLLHFPEMLMLMCFWENQHAFPKTLKELYVQIISFLWRKFCERYSVKHLNLREFLSMLGKVGLEGLMYGENFLEEKLSFQKEDFEIGCCVGILKTEGMLQSTVAVTNVSFLHKSFQEFCAAHYWASLFDSAFDQFNEILNRIDTQDAVLSKFEVVKFCCTLLCRTGGAARIIQHVINLWLREGCFCSTIAKIGKRDSLPVLILLYDSSFPKDVNFLKSLESFSSSDAITIENRTSQAIPMFYHFIKSYGTMMKHTKSVRFQDHPLGSLHVICDALALMPDIERIYIKLSSRAVAHVISRNVNQLGVCFSRLSQLVSLHVSCSSASSSKFFDISTVLHNMYTSLNSSKIMTSIEFQCVSLDGNILSKVLSSQVHLHVLTLGHLKLISGCIESVLDAIKGPLTNLNLSGTHVGNAIGHIQHIMPHLQELSLEDTDLKPEHIHTLCEFIPEKEANLSKLNLSNNDIGMAGMRLVASLKSFCKLTELNLQTTNITEECVICLAQNFCDLPNIKKLWVLNNRIRNDGIDALFRHFHHLADLNMFSFGVTVDSHCSALVKDCLAAIGKNVQAKTHILSTMSLERILSIKNAASKYVDQ